MSTNPVTPAAPAPSVGAELLKFLPIFELASNVALVALGSNGVVPSNSAALAATIEGAINPLIQNIQAGAAKSSDAVIALGALISTINVLKANKNLDPAVLTRLDEYGRAAQAGLAAYLAGAQGYDPTKLQPVQPIA